MIADSGLLVEYQTRAAETFGRLVGKPVALERMAGTRNEVFKIEALTGKTHVLKLFVDEANSIASSEPTAYRWLSKSKFVRPCVGRSDGSDGQWPFILTEYLDGKTLLEAVGTFSDSQLRNAVSQVVGYLCDCLALRTKGVGLVDSDLNGECQSWLSFLHARLDSYQARDEKISDPRARGLLSRANKCLRDFLGSHESYFEAVEPAFVPIDLNLANFLVTPEGRVFALDLETFWGADPLLAVGEWSGHAYGSSAYDIFIKEWQQTFGPLSPEQWEVVRFYSLLCNGDVLRFVLEHELAPLNEARPWGNANLFKDLIELNIASLSASTSEVWPEILSARHPFLTEDSSWKVNLTAHARTSEASEILPELLHLKNLAGITRVADITDLDSTGITVFQSVRPEAEQADNTFTVFAGSGRTKEECQVSAIAEAIERFCAEYDNFRGTVVAESYARLRQDNRVVIHPNEFNLPAGRTFEENEVLEWVRAVDLRTSEECLVPANTVFYPYTPRTGSALFRYFSTGLACGKGYAEAIAHGLSEVIERDASALNRILRDRPAVRLETIGSPEAQRLIGQLQNAGLNVVIRHISREDVRIPTFSVILDDPVLADPMYLSGGYAAHPDKELAIVRAIREAVQSRTGTISGAREDLGKFRSSKSVSYADFRKKYSYWFDSTTNAADYEEIHSCRAPSALDDINMMASALVTAGFKRILVVDLSHEELKLKTIKVLVPGVERYSFKMECVGARAKTRYRELYGRELV